MIKLSFSDKKSLTGTKDWRPFLINWRTGDSRKLSKGARPGKTLLICVWCVVAVPVSLNSLRDIIRIYLLKLLFQGFCKKIFARCSAACLGNNWNIWGNIPQYSFIMIVLFFHQQWSLQILASILMNSWHFKFSWNISWVDSSDFDCCIDLNNLQRTFKLLLHRLVIFLSYQYQTYSAFTKNTKLRWH